MGVAERMRGKGVGRQIKGIKERRATQYPPNDSWENPSSRREDPSDHHDPTLRHALFCTQHFKVIEIRWAKPGDKQEVYTLICPRSFERRQIESKVKRDKRKIKWQGETETDWKTQTAKEMTRERQSLEDRHTQRKWENERKKRMRKRHMREREREKLT